MFSKKFHSCIIFLFLKCVEFFYYYYFPIWFHKRFYFPIWFHKRFYFPIWFPQRYPLIIVKPKAPLAYTLGHTHFQHEISQFSKGALIIGGPKGQFPFFKSIQCWTYQVSIIHKNIKLLRVGGGFIVPNEFHMIPSCPPTPPKSNSQ